MSKTKSLGDPGERLAAASLWLAMLGELHPGTANDDDDKIDHRIVYSCPFSSQKLELRCQVKSGDYFGEWTKTKNRFRIDVKEQFRKRLHSNDSATLLIWIPEKHRQVFYALIPPRRNLTLPLYISPTAQVSPAMIFDIARQQAVFFRLPPPQPITFTPSNTLSDAIKKKAYRDNFKCQPRVVKDLRLPNSAMRHVTRNSRPSYRRRLSLDVLKYLPTVLSRSPYKVQCLTRTNSIAGSRGKTESLLLLDYPRAFKTIDGETYSLKIRIRERVSYPAKWQASLLCLDGPNKDTVQAHSGIETWYLERQKK